jgi:deazaflavin-dependent oxidoreductase (nitroreductase family)
MARAAPRVARRAALVARLSLWLAPSPSRALRRRNNRIDAWCQRAFGRSPSSLVSGLPMLLLTTRGRRTGLPRTVALAYAEVDGAWVVVGGDHGAPRDPQWVANLIAEPAVEVELGRRRLAARALVVPAAEHDELWRRVAAQLPTIGLYRALAGRRIPIVRIVARPMASDPEVR